MPEEALPAFDQRTIDACAGIKITKAADALAACGQDSFYAWYNARFKGHPAFPKKHFPAEDTDAFRKAFTTFWDLISLAFGRESISGLEFCALMGINLQEASGNLAGKNEMVNGSDVPHPGLAYAFDRIPNKKHSYNNGGSNRTCLALFSDALFLKAHRQKAGADAILNRPTGIDPKWGGDTWPAGVPTTPDAAMNGFVMEADFYKFRGRGVIQTTWRAGYEDLIRWILGDGAAANPVLAELAKRWQDATKNIEPAKQVSAIATISSNADWNTAFSQAITLAKGIAIFSASKKNFVNGLKKDLATLEGSVTTPGSLRFFASRINGGDYADTVAPKMKALICGLAEVQFKKA